MPTIRHGAAIAVEDSIEALFARHDTTTRWVYLATTASAIAGLVGGALAHVDVTVRAPATLAPAIERQTLRTLSEGMVDHVLTRTGQYVSAGDTLVALVTTDAERALAAAMAALVAQERRRTERRTLLESTVRATHSDSSSARLPLPQSGTIATATYVEWKHATLEVARAERVRDRTAQLLERGFAMPAEVEAAEFDLQRAREERSLALERRRSSWTEDLADADQRIAELRRDVAALHTARAARYIVAPVSGTVEEITPLAHGSSVRAGDVVATISPDGSLVADALVAPRDVAYLRVGMPARLLVEGFDVQEWGAAEAVITSVAQDYALSEGHPVFRVLLRPVHTVLRRANGTTARLGKGLRCQVRFLLGERRVADLLRRRAREWFDPVAPGGH